MAFIKYTLFLGGVFDRSCFWPEIKAMKSKVHEVTHLTEMMTEFGSHSCLASIVVFSNSRIVEPTAVYYF